MGIESRSLTRALKTMESEGLITKVPDDTDGRMVRVFLTPEGEKYRETARNSVIDLNNHLQNNISPTELKTFFKVAMEINALLDQNNIFAESRSTRKKVKTI
jgi:DNA-binding MarR family transcriptional regulator